MRDFFPPVFTGLRRVIPIAQAQRCGDVTVTVVALEVYEREGCILALLLESGPGAHGANERYGRAFLQATLRDDRGVVHMSARRPSEGATGPDYVAQRALLPFYGATIAPDAEMIEIEIPELHWERYESRTDSEGVTIIPREITPGPWHFTVALHPEQNAASSPPGGSQRSLAGVMRALRAFWSYRAPATPQH